MSRKEREIHYSCLLGIHAAAAFREKNVRHAGQVLFSSGRAEQLDCSRIRRALSAQAGHFSAKDFLFILPLSLSKTQDDKGRVQWTLFGSSEQGPEMAFWKSFRDTSRMEIPESESRLVSAQGISKFIKFSFLRIAKFACAEAACPSACPP